MTLPTDRRRFIRRAAAAGCAVLLPGFARAQKPVRVPPITMVINQSPWVDGFRRLV